MGSRAAFADVLWPFEHQIASRNLCAPHEWMRWNQRLVSEGSAFYIRTGDGVAREVVWFGVSCDVTWSSWYVEYVAQWDDEVQLRLCWSRRGTRLISAILLALETTSPRPVLQKRITSTLWRNRTSNRQIQSAVPELSTHSPAQAVSKRGEGRESALQAPSGKRSLHRGTSLE